MILNFANGTQAQKAAVEFTLHHLLNFPFEDIPLEVEYQFVADPDPSLHNEFAVTTYTFGSNKSTTEVGSVAPNWGDPYRGIRFLNEVVAHETGHALFAALPEHARLAIAEMFGATTSSLEELSPEDSAWEDRIIEGIAETFKDAFLPQRYRVYSNRTNHKISMSRYPEFRRLFRTAAPEVLRGGTPLEPGDEEVPGYSADYFAEGEPFESFGFGDAYLAGPDGKHGLWSTVLEEFFVEEERSGAVLRSASTFGAWVKHGTVLQYSFLLPLSAFPDAQSEFHWKVFYHSFVPGPTFPSIMDARWLQQPDPEFPPFTKEGEAVLLGDPPVVVSQEIAVTLPRFTKTRKCGGATYRWVELSSEARFGLEQNYVHADNEALRQAIFYPWLPELKVLQSACTGLGVPGTPILLPSPTLQPVGTRGGTRRKNRLISGGRTG